MIRWISFKENPIDRNGLKPYYALRLPKLRGTTFEFCPGLNFIVGYNGCGKSTLLNVIKQLTFCTQSLHSSAGDLDDTMFNYMGDIWRYSLDLNVDMNINYLMSTYTMMEHTFMCNSVNIPDEASAERNILSRKESMGMRTFNNMTAAYESFRNGTRDEHSFARMVIKKLIHMKMRYNTEPAKECLKYINSHHVGQIGDKYTMLLDEPDRNTDPWLSHLMLDYFDKKMHEMLELDPQVIVVLHNPVILYHLYKKYQQLPEIHQGYLAKFIELTPTYLDNICAFVEGKELIEVKTPDWTLQNSPTH